ncbi:dTDP-4-dehydrorhamnose reductase [Dactylosporangium matsuzakiense]|uniref:dTDP-4-dehydrorhamnose reductase n=1 Tax=Dactylosporangium matsuzakiense TaxID=53360 RepID=A0A9W6KCV3_9ACTN|nr:dTDP-4-dehydrorhamnose reductase [Dactylosporangium matsuzakiense]UWZ42131.1 dTDP-4-dehydrorhamnose reductase [Dactylosporangium matsuzakiense]GLK99761.1 NAD(P)-dependent oxidoreductase [Dactylosporangium matsuzakiense]
MSGPQRSAGHTARFLVTGAGGMLGRDLLAVLADHDVTAATRAELDITDTAKVRDLVNGHDVVINAAAWTDVDGAEADEAAATAVNGTGVEVLAQACAAAGARLIHVSTDYVFPGDATEPYAEDAPTDPINAYGRSKLAGERAALRHGGHVVRTAWLYGETGRNFVTTMLRLAGEREFVEVVDDQLGQPTWSRDLAERLVQLALADAPAGVYHGTASGQVTWFGLAQAVFAEAGHDPARVRPTTSAAYARPAKRPAYSVLGHGRWAAAGLAPMRQWRAMLHDMVPGVVR